MNLVVEYDLVVNGLKIKANYSEDTVNEILLTLVDKMQQLYRLKQNRIIVFIAAPPATGKSTLTLVLEKLAREKGYDNIQALGMDGFHYDNEYLNNNYHNIDGRKTLLKNIKGSPETFNIEKLFNKIEHLKYENILWPIYDRILHDVVEDQIKVEKNIILIEGNWLLLNEDKWRELKALCDYSVLIKAKLPQLKERLINRKVMGGKSIEEATKFYEESDSKNVIRMLNNCLDADLCIDMIDELNYKIEKRV